MAKAEKQQLSQGSENIHPQLEALSIHVSLLNLDPKNTRLHGKRNLEAIKASLAKFGQRKPIVVRKQGMIIEAGNGTYEAALSLGWKRIAAIVCEDQEEIAKAYSIADNRTAELATWDENLLAEAIKELADFEDFDISVTGFDIQEVEEFIRIANSGLKEVEKEFYTKKILAPIYEPKGERPDISELVDCEKTTNLIKQIDDSPAPKEVKDFLRLAAQRHNVFSYEKIAEYYAHAPKEVQALMEQSALVIIDFDKAIENGFVSMSEEIAESYSETYE